MILPFEYESYPPHLIGDSQEIKDMNLINDEIFSILDRQHKSKQYAYDIFMQIEEALMRGPSVVYDLPFNDLVYDKPIQQVSVVYKTAIEEYNLVFPITCFNFHSKKSLEAFISEKENFNVKLIKHKEIKQDDIYFLPLTACAANKNIKYIFPQTLDKEIEYFFFRRKMDEINFTDELYDWKKVKSLMESDDVFIENLLTIIYYSSWKNLSSIYKDSIAYFIEGLKGSFSIHTIDNILNCPLYKLMCLIKTTINSKSKELYDELAKDIEMKLSHSEFEELIKEFILFIYYLIGYARVKSMNNDTIDTLPWGGFMGIDWYSAYYI